MRISRERVRECLLKNMSNLEIANRLGCAPNSITDIKRELGFPIIPYRGLRGSKSSTEGARKGGIASSIKARAIREQPVLTIVKPCTPPEPQRYGRSPCPWLLGDQKPFTPCGEKTLHGRVYCEDHCRKAYAVLTPGKRILA